MHPFFIASFIVYYIAWLLFFSPTVRVLRIWTQRSIPPKLELTRLTLITTGVPLARFLLFFFFFFQNFFRVSRVSVYLHLYLFMLSQGNTLQVLLLSSH